MVRQRSHEPDRVAQLDEQLVSGLSPRRIPSFTQLKLLPRVLNQREQFVVLVLTLIFLTSTLWLLLRLVGRFTQPFPIAGGTYIEGVVGQPQYINPVFASANDADDDLIRLVHAGLFRFSADHFVVPELAESFTMNPEETVYTVVLKPDLRWSDGEPLTVDDVVFSFALIQDPTFKSPLNAAFSTVTVERVDDRTVRFTLKEPLAPFLSSLTVGIIPEHRWREVLPTNARLNKLNLEPVGAGPYRVQEIKLDSAGNVRSYTLEPNEFSPGTPTHIANIELRFFPDPNTAVEALRRSRVDGLSFVSSEQKDAVEATKTRLLPLRLPQYTALFLNLKRGALDDVKVREALALAADRTAITRTTTNNSAAAVDGPLPPGFSASTDAAVVRPYDPGRANALLDEAGWAKGEDGLRRKNDKTLTLTVTTSDRPDYQRAAELIADAWRAVGVDARVTIVAASQIQREVIKPRDYDIILFSQIVGADPDPFPFWHSSQERDPGLNLAIFFNKETDKLLEDARATSNLDERTAKYSEFQNRLNEIIPAIFLWQPNYLYALPKKVKGFDQVSLIEPADRFAEIENWYMKTRRRFR